MTPVPVNWYVLSYVFDFNGQAVYPPAECEFFGFIRLMFGRVHVWPVPVHGIEFEQ